MFILLDLVSNEASHCLQNTPSRHAYQQNSTSYILFLYSINAQSLHKR
jgi:hypothetical protein